MIQVDALCHKIPNFIEKAKRAGVTRVFIGLENINADNLAAAKKRQNKITEYRKMLLAWKAQGIITLAGYILGFPADTPETIRRDIAIMQKELPLDVIEFFCLTPLPGSEDHQTLWKNGVAMDPDLNKYDAEHICAAHPKMSKAEWDAIYLEAWSLYYTREHMETLLRRAAATGVPMFSLLKVLATFASAVTLENVHPLQCGIFRLKRPSERRPGLPRENSWIFWPRFAWESLRKHCDPDRHNRAAHPVEDRNNTRSQRDELHGSGAHAGPRRRRRDVRSSHQDRRRAGCYCARQESRRADRHALELLTGDPPLRIPIRRPCLFDPAAAFLLQIGDDVAARRRLENANRHFRAGNECLRIGQPPIEVL